MAKKQKTIRQPRSTFLGSWVLIPLAKPKPLGGEAQAVLWLRWSCQRDGIEFPAGDVEITFYEERGHGKAYVYSQSWSASYYHREAKRGDLLMERDVPAWAMPCKRADLFIAAQQSGKSLSDCLMFGRQHWQDPTQASMSGEAWDQMKAHEMLDYQARHRREDSSERKWHIEQEIDNLDASEELRADWKAAA